MIGPAATAKAYLSNELERQHDGQDGPNNMEIQKIFVSLDGPQEANRTNYEQKSTNYLQHDKDTAQEKSQLQRVSKLCP